MTSGRSRPDPDLTPYQPDRSRRFEMHIVHEQVDVHADVEQAVERATVEGVQLHVDPAELGLDPGAEPVLRGLVLPGPGPGRAQHLRGRVWTDLPDVDDDQVGQPKARLLRCPRQGSAGGRTAVQADNDTPGHRWPGGRDDDHREPGSVKTGPGEAGKPGRSRVPAQHQQVRSLREQHGRNITANGTRGRREREAEV
jgi:hypothetical protein